MDGIVYFVFWNGLEGFVHDSVGHYLSFLYADADEFQAYSVATFLDSAHIQCNKITTS